MSRLLILAARADIDAIHTLLTRTGWRTRRIAQNTEADLLRSCNGSSIDRVAEGRADPAVLLADVDLMAAAERIRAIRTSDSASRIRIVLAAVRPKDLVLRQAVLRAIQAGADDFVNVATLGTELGLRIEALVWRDKQRASLRVWSICGMRLERATRRLRHGERSVLLTPCEYRVLLCLATHTGKPVSRSLIRHRLGRASKGGGGNFVDVHVLYLRRKLAELSGPCDIRTVRGVGYELSADSRAGYCRATNEALVAHSV